MKGRRLGWWHASLLLYTVPYRTVPYRTVPYRTVPYRTVPYRTVPYVYYVGQKSHWLVTVTLTQSALGAWVFCRCCMYGFIHILFLMLLYVRLYSYSISNACRVETLIMCAFGLAREPQTAHAFFAVKLRAPRSENIRPQSAVQRAS